jgi:radical SAM superfamily enzyme YgiQ (UPF0313 family)
LAYLEREQFDIDYMDCTLNEDPWRDLEEKVRREKPEVIGISVGCTAFIYDGMNAASLMKAISPQSIIIMGGEHPSFMAEETLRDCPAVDYICVGEGEVTMTEFLRAVKEQGASLHRGSRYPPDACLPPRRDGAPLCGPSIGRKQGVRGQFFTGMYLGLFLLFRIGFL